jgi:hypothetical protein
MKSKSTILFAAIFLCLFSSPVWAQPVTVRYSSGHDHAFWITNNTDKTLLITVDKIEVLGDAGWKDYSRPDPGPGSLFFSRVPNILGDCAASRTCLLAAHQAGYGRLQSQNLELPPYGVWRVTVVVEEQLTGQEAAEALAKYQAVLAAAAKSDQSVRAKDKSPIMANYSFLGHPLVIHSEAFREL